jgi:UDP-GlcNAc:undecaprenyl-phosphate/decaprenyl-phosphate GlcNAc-1-phosphate transferase
MILCCAAKQQGMAIYIVFFITAVAGGVFFTWMVRGLAIKNNIVNMPNPLIPQHTKPIAYLGGVGIFLGLAFSLILTAQLFKGHPIFSFENVDVFRVLGIGTLLFLLFGIYDDILPLKPFIKLIGQIILAIVAVAIGLRTSFLHYPVLDFIFSVCWIVFIVNAVNLTDVCDGLVAGLCVVIFGATALLVNPLFVIGLLISGATLGFFYFNKPRASIFLGDAGAHLLGFLLAALTIMGTRLMESIPTTIAWLALVPGVPAFELVFLVCIRVWKGIPWYKGSRDHFSLRLQAAGFNRWQTGILAWTVQGLLVTIACIYPGLSTTTKFVVVGLVLAFLTFAWRYLLRNEVK